MNKKIGTLVMNNLKGYYDYERHNKENDPYLKKLMQVFDDVPEWTMCVKKELLNSNSPGITGNASNITIENDKVIIEPLYVKDPHEYAIEIDRYALLNLINKWQELVSKECKKITFTRHEDGTITLTDQ